MKETKKFIAIALVSAIAVSTPLIVCAETYDLSNGSVAVLNDVDGRYVTQDNVCSHQLETTETVIEMKDQAPTENTITLINGTDAEFEVTIKDVNIDSYITPIFTTSMGNTYNTTINVDGDNSLTSACGIENYTKNLTIKGKDASASLNITADDIGILNMANGKDTTLTISDLNLDIDTNYIGIYNEFYGDGKLAIESSDVDIDAANIGIYINNGLDSANNVIDITDSNVDSEAGEYSIAVTTYGEGNAEANLNGCHVAEPVGGQWTLLKIDYGQYIYGYSADGQTVTKLLIVKDSNTAPAEEAEETSYYHILNEKGARCSYTSEREGSVLVINCERDYAKLVLTQAEMNELLDDGIDTVKFVTNGAESRFKLADVLAEIKPGARLSDLHDGKDVTLLLGKEEANKLLG